MENKEYDFLAIGDIVTDAFIRLKDAGIHCDINNEKCEICLAFKAKIPYEKAYVIPAVGNSPNAAVAASRLGLKTALVTDLGSDYFGKECLDVLGTEKISEEFIRTHEGEKTNYHYVLWYDNDRTILVKHEKYNYKLPDINHPKWVYLSSLGENSLGYHKEIENYLGENSGVKLAFQPGTFQIKFGKDTLAGIYSRADLFFCNKDEAQKILGMEEHDVKTLLKNVKDIGPKIVVITDGPLGAYVYDGSNFWSMSKYPDPKPPLERTGAGDAFSSTFTSAIALGMSIEDALRWAPVNSMSVVQYVGAREGLLTREKIEGYLKDAPENYEPKLI